MSNLIFVQKAQEFFQLWYRFAVFDYRVLVEFLTAKVKGSDPVNVIGA